jgi:FkbM family methyltransferase
MLQISEFTKYFPVSFGLSGRKRAAAIQLFDTLFPLKKEKYHLEKHGITLNPGILNERLLFYFFYNVIRFFKSSDLYKYLYLKKNKGGIFLDIGANLAIYSYLAKKLGYQSYAFEPEPDLAAYLKANPVLYSKYFEIALSDKKEKVSFYKSNFNPGAGTLVLGNADVSIYQKKFEIETDRLDVVLSDSAILKRISVIKIDVEGAEELVVRGMENVLKENSQMAIWCEVRGYQSRRNPGSYERINIYLSQFNYNPFIYQNNKFVPFTEKYERQVFDILYLAD